MIENNKHRNLLQFLIIFAISLCFSSCTIVDFNVSVPEEIPYNSKGKISDEILCLNASGVQIKTQLQTYQPASDKKFIKALGIWLEFKSDKKTLILNPRQVSLKIGEGGELLATTYMGPKKSWSSPRAAAMGCGPRVFNLGPAINRIAVTHGDVIGGNVMKDIFRVAYARSPEPFSGKNNCFMFWFDMDANPEYNYTLSIKGLQSNGRPIAVPEMHFKKGNVVKYFPLF